VKYGTIFFAVAVLTFGLSGLSSGAVNISIGFIGDETAFGDHNNAAFEWAEENFVTALISPDDLAAEDLTQYAVLWWQDGDTDPNGLMTDNVIGALIGYLDSGGSLLLSSAAEMLATPLGVESGAARIYGPGTDAQAAGLTIRDDTVDHPVWEGFDREAGTQIQVTSVGYPMTSDYWSSTFVDAVTIGDCWETGTDYGDVVGAFVEWEQGDGLVFGMGWRLAHWIDNNTELETLYKLTANVICYLADQSAFLAVSPQGNAISTWARVKAAR